MLDREKHDKPAFLKKILKLDTNTQGEIMGEIEKMVNRGMQRGMQQGRQQGRQEERKSIFSMLIERGIVTPDQIKNLK